MNKIVLNSPAKINLALDVLGYDKKKKYHRIQTILHKIDLHDTIVIQRMSTKKREVSCVFLDKKNFSKKQKIQLQGEKNIAYQAAQLFFQETKISSGIKITIKKKIPVSSGLGGGSSNAATVLRGLCRLFQIKISSKKMQKLGEEIGMDVPFFLYKGRTALAKHFGEKITPLPCFNHKNIRIIISTKTAKESTKSIYQKLTKQKLKTGDSTEKTKKITEILNTRKKMTAQVLEDIEKNLHNDFEIFYPNIQKNEHLSGSGPARFSVL